MHKRILYCVLDWGLGHATRSIPIIRALLDRGYEVILASDNLALDFLRTEFPSLTSYKLPSYNVEYLAENLFLNGIYNLKRIRSAIKAEHALTRHIAKKDKIDAIISDNRYGCHVAGLPSVMVTHQLQFRTGNTLQDRIGKMLISKLLKSFDHIWIPDDEERTLSGVLSMSGESRVKCIGWQSTLVSSSSSMEMHQNKRNEARKEYIIAAILSGPEPMRTTLEVEIRRQLETLDAKCALVRGVKGSPEARQEGNITVYDTLDRTEVGHLINSTSVIVCRSGYSSLMDLQTTGKKALLIPTPGQPEQKYLAERMRSIPNYVVQEQGELDIKSAMDRLATINSTNPGTVSSYLLDNAIKNLFKNTS